MNSADKLWELKKLEYKRDVATRKLDTVYAMIDLDMINESFDVEMNNLGKEYSDWQKLDYNRCFKNHKEENERCTGELKAINDKISKLLEDE